MRVWQLSVCIKRIATFKLRRVLAPALTIWLSYHDDKILVPSDSPRFNGGTQFASRNKPLLTSLPPLR